VILHFISENKVIIIVFSRIQPLTVLTVAQSFISCAVMQYLAV